MKNITKIVVGLIISISLCFILLYKIDIKEIWDDLKSFQTIYILILIMILLIGLAVRCLRWKLLINQENRVSFTKVLNAMLFGFMLNNLLPAKLEEFARAEYLKKKEGGSRSFYLGTVFIERILDVLIVFVFLALSVIYSQALLRILKDNKWILILVTVFLMVSLYFLIQSNTSKKLLNWIPGRIGEKITLAFSSFSSAANFVKNKKLIIKVIVLSLVVWLLTYFSCFIILHGLGVNLAFSAYFFIIVAGVLGMVIPSSSGGIGVYHAVSTAALLMFSIDKDIALTYAIISHAFDFFPNVFFGLIVLLKDYITSVKKPVIV